MFSYVKHQREKFLFSTISRLTVFVLSLSLIFSPAAAQAQSVNFLNLPIPGTMISPSPAFVPVLLKGMTIDANNPLNFDFIVDSGNTNFTTDQIKEESQKLVKYFLASMTVPKDDLWVNLSPYENDRIIPEELGKTELGRDMLAQDYILKQLTASLVYPEKELGKKFWDKIYEKAEEQFGTSEIPVNTFNKVWILPETAKVYVHEQTVYVVDAYLKVMLDSDYAAMEHSQNNGDTDLHPAQNDSMELSRQIIREIIIPEIEREVNEGQHFAPLRQVYHSLILAKWYKETIKDSLLSQVYADKNMIDGIESEEKNVKNRIYDQYMEAYKKGVFNYIREDHDRLSKEIIPRKYFSGGELFDNFSIEETNNPDIKETEENLYLTKVINIPQNEGEDLIDLGIAASPIEQTAKKLGEEFEGKSNSWKKINFIRDLGLQQDFENDYEVIEFLKGLFTHDKRNIRKEALLSALYRGLTPEEAASKYETIVNLKLGKADAQAEAAKFLELHEPTFGYKSSSPIENEKENGRREAMKTMGKGLVGLAAMGLTGFSASASDGDKETVKKNKDFVNAIKEYIDEIFKMYKKSKDKYRDPDYQNEMNQKLKEIKTLISSGKITKENMNKALAYISYNLRIDNKDLRLRKLFTSLIKKAIEKDIEEDVNINSMVDNLTPLMNVSINHSSKVSDIRFILDFDPDLDKKNDYGETTLLNVLKYPGKLSNIEALVEEGKATVGEHRDNRDRTELMIIALAYPKTFNFSDFRKDAASYFINHIRKSAEEEARKNKLGEKEITEKGQKAVEDYILYESKETGESALDMAIDNYDFGFVHTIRINGVHVKGSSHFEKKYNKHYGTEAMTTKFFEHIDWGNFDEISEMLDQGFDVNTRSNDTGKTALMIGAGWGNTKLITLLRKKGADNGINFKNYRGNSALMFAVGFTSSTSETAMQILDIPGIDVNIKNMRNKTALDLAKSALKRSKKDNKKEKEKIIQMLEDAGAVSGSSSSPIEDNVNGRREAMKTMGKGLVGLAAMGLPGFSSSANSVDDLKAEEFNNYFTDLVYRTMRKTFYRSNLRDFITRNSLERKRNEGFSEIKKLLSERGDEITQESKDLALIHTANKFGYFHSISTVKDLFILLVENDANINAVFGEHTILMSILENLDFWYEENFIKSMNFVFNQAPDLDISIKNEDGDTPLMHFIHPLAFFGKVKFLVKGVNGVKATVGEHRDGKDRTEIMRALGRYSGSDRSSLELRDEKILYFIDQIRKNAEEEARENGLNEEEIKEEGKRAVKEYVNHKSDKTGERFVDIAIKEKDVYQMWLYTHKYGGEDMEIPKKLQSYYDNQSQKYYFKYGTRYKPKSKSSSPISNNPTDKITADELSAKTSDKLAKKLKYLMFADINELEPSRDTFILIELMSRGKVAVGAAEFKEKLREGTDISEYSGEALVRWLYDRGVIQYVKDSEVPVTSSILYASRLKARETFSISSMAQAYLRWAKGFSQKATNIDQDQSSSPIEKVGGIDMNNIEVESQEQGVHIEFNPVQLQEIIDMGITGFSPVIINITPLPSVLPLLGLAPQKEEDYLEVSSLDQKAIEPFLSKLKSLNTGRVLEC